MWMWHRVGNEDAAFAASQPAPGAHAGELGDVSTTSHLHTLRCNDSPDLAGAETHQKTAGIRKWPKRALDKA